MDGSIATDADLKKAFPGSAQEPENTEEGPDIIEEITAIVTNVKRVAGKDALEPLAANTPWGHFLTGGYYKLTPAADLL